MLFSRYALVFIMLLAANHLVNGQGNCLLYTANSGERLACELSYRAIEYKQGGKNSQILFDAAIKLGAAYAYAYYEKSVPFFKWGLLRQGVELLNQAIALEPENYLCYRAYWYFSHRSYEMAIKDLEHYYFALNGPARTTPGGDLEMRMLLGMAYVQTNQSTKAAQVVSDGMAGYKSEGFPIGPYACHMLGVFYYKNDQLSNAVESFKMQIEMNEHFADSYYYLALIRQEEDKLEESKELLELALSKLGGQNGGYSFNGFDAFNVYKVDVERKLSSLIKTTIKPQS